jgi:ppGpp synthetase/RelA/SpoT-type nucleotidyltranferase
MNNEIIIPNKEQLQFAYDSYKPVLTAILFSIEQKLKKNLKLASMPTFKTRIKDFNSYYKKLLRVRPKSIGKQNLPTLTDLLGIRVICAFLEDLKTVEEQISKIFKIIEIERKGADRTFSEFGYESIHFLVEIPEEFKTDKDTVPDGLVCEIQVRTILQDAWAEVEHELVYKSEFSPFDLPLRRKLASLNASLSLSDIIFQEIRDYQNKLNKELDCRRESFYDKADNIARGIILEKNSEEIETNIETERSPTDMASPYIRGTIDDMILEAIHAHNTGNLEKAVEIYTKIIEAKPSPNDIVLSVIYKHRGMAKFAMNNFEQALEDFNNSCKYDPSSFRSYYYVGIVYSVLGQNEKALEAFDKSLELNGFQAHVYYRKALACYNDSNYSQALNDLQKGISLGLDDEDSKKLHNKIMSKLDMCM